MASSSAYPVSDELLAQQMQEREGEESESETATSNESDDGTDAEDEENKSRDGGDKPDKKDGSDDAGDGDVATSSAGIAPLIDIQDDEAIESFINEIKGKDVATIHQADALVKSYLRDVKRTLSKKIDLMTALKKEMKARERSLKFQKKREEKKSQKYEEMLLKQEPITINVVPVGFENLTTGFTITIPPTETIATLTTDIAKAMNKLMKTTTNKLNKKGLTITFNDVVLDSGRKTIAGASIKENNTIYIKMKGVGGSKKMKKSTSTLKKGSKQDDLNNEIALVLLRVSGFSTLPLVADISGISNKLKVEVGNSPNNLMTEVIKKLSVGEMKKLLDICTTTGNFDFKMEKISQTIFSQKISSITDVQRHLDALEHGLNQTTQLLMLSQFQNDDGSLSWTKFMSCLTDSIVEVEKSKVSPTTAD